MSVLWSMQRNGSNITTEDPGFEAPFVAFLFVILFAVVLVVVMNVLTLAVLARTRSVAKLVRIFLSNILAAGLFSACVGAAFCVTGIALAFTDTHNGTATDSGSTASLHGFCRFLVWGYGVAAIVRLYCLAAFSVAVLHIVRSHQSRLHPVYTALLVITTWAVSILLNTHILVRPFYDVQYYKGVACFPKTVQADIIREARYTFTAIWIAIGGCLPLIVSTVIPVVILCCIRRSAKEHACTAGGSWSYGKGIARLTLFLLVGNFINFLSQTVVGALVYDSQSSAAVFLSYGIGFLTLIPTSIMIALFLKPIRSKVFRVFGRIRIASASASSSARRHTMPMKMNVLDQATLLRHTEPEYVQQ